MRTDNAQTQMSPMLDRLTQMGRAPIRKSNGYSTGEKTPRAAASMMVGSANPALTTPYSQSLRACSRFSGGTASSTYLSSQAVISQAMCMTDSRAR